MRRTLAVHSLCTAIDFMLPIHIAAVRPTRYGDQFPGSVIGVFRIIPVNLNHLQSGSLKQQLQFMAKGIAGIYRNYALARQLSSRIEFLELEFKLPNLLHDVVPDQALLAKYVMAIRKVKFLSYDVRIIRFL